MACNSSRRPETVQNGLYWPNMAQNGPFWAVSVYFRPFWAVTGHYRQFQAIPGFQWPCQIVLGCFGMFWIVSGRFRLLQTVLVISSYFVQFLAVFSCRVQCTNRFFSMTTQIRVMREHTNIQTNRQTLLLYIYIDGGFCRPHPPWIWDFRRVLPSWGGQFFTFRTWNK